MRQRYRNIRREWKEIAKSAGRCDLEYLFRLFDDEALEFEVIRKNAKALEVKVTRCMYADRLKKLHVDEIGQKLICNRDTVRTEAFDPKIRFRRPKLIMRGDEYCHFIWELQESQ